MVLSIDVSTVDEEIKVEEELVAFDIVASQRNTRNNQW